MKQENILPIIAKDHLLDNWKKYNVTDTKKDFLALLNILQAIGENLDSLHSAYINGKHEFSGIWHYNEWESDKAIADALFEYCSFYTEDEFIEMILDRAEEYETSAEWSEDIRMETSDDPDSFCDCQILKTDDGYVKRVWY